MVLDVLIIILVLAMGRIGNWFKCLSLHFVAVVDLVCFGSLC